MGQRLFQLTKQLLRKRLQVRTRFHWRTPHDERERARSDVRQREDVKRLVF
ncbi:hypothetical protein D3C73_1565890 [compost metagenome]